jgi:hypothetical protein
VASDITTTNGYIPFSSATDTSVSLKTNDNLRYNANSKILSVDGISITNNLTLPATFSTPTSGQLGYQVYGTVISNSGVANGVDTQNGVAIATDNGFASQASINLQPGVWLIMSSMWFIPSTSANIVFSAIISTTTNADDNARRKLSLIGNNSTGLNNIITPVSAVVNVNTNTPYYLVASTTAQVAGTSINHILFYATRIA